MPKAILISGLGADKRLYKHILIPDGFEVVYADWLLPNEDDTLGSYAQSLISQYHISTGDVVIGVSFGGIISTEIAKCVDLRCAILISSIKTDAEAPLYFKIFRKLPVYKIIPVKVFNRMSFLVEYVFGAMSAQDKMLFKNMLTGCSPIFLKWAMGAVLAWRNHIAPQNLYHIVGDHDLVFPYKNIKAPTAVIKGGTHMMVFDRADEINKIIHQILK
ncbi:MULTISPECIES: alpha/beta hydrolase [unclassified Mucilaginibacter]|uniref:alpha/beta hydrolase n=1 Tax=unclassified Mucilaginibacter TaxID=2617802 RepID=UPI000966EF49|nr:MULTISPECIES: alpha/beta hydrolase [unclassified Mucilaginibacter]OJW18430.1 MAG: hypothetical protein BGO48_18000 [Mucilaginibacter sp. 44-25]PLW89360.1 MAG: hypothetical protein C0154_12115 [Mucilaginibacter sp.]PMP64669.1 MAG: hypothetical protein C0191_05975 [Mucilaginibacter sp.]HEK21264.1 alpha/beta hydrolase [Bacteroidota bacterium]